MSEPDDIAAAMDTAVSGVLSAEGLPVNRWVVLAEIVDDDGDRELWMCTSPGLKRWDSLGLLTHAVHSEQAATIREQDA